MNSLSSLLNTKWKVTRDTYGCYQILLLLFQIYGFENQLMRNKTTELLVDF